MINIIDIRGPQISYYAQSKTEGHSNDSMFLRA